MYATAHATWAVPACPVTEGLQHSINMQSMRSRNNTQHAHTTEHTPRNSSKSLYGQHVSHQGPCGQHIEPKVIFLKKVLVVKRTEIYISGTAGVAPTQSTCYTRARAVAHSWLRPTWLRRIDTGPEGARDPFRNQLASRCNPGCQSGWRQCAIYSICISAVERQHVTCQRRNVVLEQGLQQLKQHKTGAGPLHAGPHCDRLPQCCIHASHTKRTTRLLIPQSHPKVSEPETGGSGCTLPTTTHPCSHQAQT